MSENQNQQKVQNPQTSQKLNRDRRSNWKQERAKEPDTLVIKASSERVITALNMLAQTDYVIKRIQNRVGVSLDIKDAEKAFDEWTDIVLRIDKFTEKYSKTVGVNYIESNSLKRIKDMSNKDNVDDNAEEVTDSKSSTTVINSSKKTKE